VRTKGKAAAHDVRYWKAASGEPSDRNIAERIPDSPAAYALLNTGFLKRDEALEAS